MTIKPLITGQKFADGFSRPVPEINSIRVFQRGEMVRIKKTHFEERECKTRLGKGCYRTASLHHGKKKGTIRWTNLTYGKNSDFLIGKIQEVRAVPTMCLSCPKDVFLHYFVSLEAWGIKILVKFYHEELEELFPGL